MPQSKSVKKSSKKPVKKSSKGIKKISKPQANKIDKARFHGSWKMRSYTTQVGHGKARSAFGEKWGGRLIYSGNHVCGCASGKLVPYKKPFQPSDGWIVGSPAECQYNAKKLLSYSGRVTVDAAKKLVTHHVDVAASPKNSSIFAGGKQVRQYSFSKNDKVLQLIAVIGKIRHVVTWDKE